MFYEDDVALVEAVSDLLVDVESDEPEVEVVVVDPLPLPAESLDEEVLEEEEELDVLEDFPLLSVL